MLLSVSLSVLLVDYFISDRVLCVGNLRGGFMIASCDVRSS
jgi:hypothetical protein